MKTKISLSILHSPFLFLLMLGIFIFPPLGEQEGSLQAQTRRFEWAHTMGSALGGRLNDKIEYVQAIDQDEAGNIYILADVLNYPKWAYIDSILADVGFDSSFYPEDYIYTRSEGHEILLSSFDSQGRFRWKKLLTSSGGGGADGLKVHQGFVYLYGSLCGDYSTSPYPYSDSILIDKDTTYCLSWEEANINGEGFFIKWDTSGVLQWLKQPGYSYIYPSISTDVSRAYPIHMDVDEEGYFFCVYKYEKRETENEFVPMPRYPYVVVRLNADWEVIDKTVLDIEGLRYGEAFTYGGGKYYMTGMNEFINKRGEYVGWDTAIVVGDDTLRYDPAWYEGWPQIDSSFTILASFNRDGSANWGKIIGRPTPINQILADSSGFVYLSGSALPYPFPASVIGSDTIFDGSIVPYILKLDSLGNRVWLSHGVEGSAQQGTIAFMPGNRLALAGSFSGSISFDTLTVRSLSDSCCYRQAFFATLNKSTGQFLSAGNLGLSSVAYPGPYPALCGTDLSVMTDNYGNLFPSGQFYNMLYLDSITLIEKKETSRMTNDLFVCKYGYPYGVYDPYILDSVWVRDTLTPIIIDTLITDTTLREHFTVNTIIKTVIYTDSISQEILRLQNDTLLEDDLILSDLLINKTFLKGEKPGLIADKDTLFFGSYFYDPLYYSGITRYDTVYIDSSSGIGIETVAKGEKYMHISPNPARTEVNIAYDLPPFKGEASMEIYDLQGKQKGRWTLSQAQGEFRISVKDWTPGVYMLKLLTQGQALETRKLVITK